MSSDEVREIIAGLREGDEVEVIYRGRVDRTNGGDVALDDNGRWCLGPHEVRVIKRAPLPEPPVGTPVWWDGKWWAKRPGAGSYAQLGSALDFTGAPRWETMDGAVPAATPGGDDE